MALRPIGTSEARAETDKFKNDSPLASSIRESQLQELCENVNSIRKKIDILILDTDKIGEISLSLSSLQRGVNNIERYLEPSLIPPSYRVEYPRTDSSVNDDTPRPYWNPSQIKKSNKPASSDSD